MLYWTTGADISNGIPLLDLIAGAFALSNARPTLPNCRKRLLTQIADEKGELEAAVGAAMVAARNRESDRHKDEDLGFLHDSSPSSSSSDSSFSSGGGDSGGGGASSDF